VKESSPDASHEEIPGNNDDLVEPQRQPCESLRRDTRRDTTSIVDNFERETIELSVHPPQAQRVHLGWIGSDMNGSPFLCADARCAPSCSCHASIRRTHRDDHRPPTRRPASLELVVDAGTRHTGDYYDLGWMPSRPLTRSQQVLVPN
jgi:hypothetical protein